MNRIAIFVFRVNYHPPFGFATDTDQSRAIQSAYSCSATAAAASSSSASIASAFASPQLRVYYLLLIDDCIIRWIFMKIAFAQSVTIASIDSFALPLNRHAPQRIRFVFSFRSAAKKFYMHDQLL